MQCWKSVKFLTEMQSKSQRSDLLLSEVGGEDKLKVTFLTANFTQTADVYKM